jgi:hypothetical protein
MGDRRGTGRRGSRVSLDSRRDFSGSRFVDGMFYISLLFFLGVTGIHQERVIEGDVVTGISLSPYAFDLLANHSFNLSNAFPRCEILFFSLLSISAYVWPSYSKHESQPVRIQSQQLHVFFRRTTRLIDIWV